MNRPLRPSRNLLLRSVAAGLLTGMAALAMFCWVVVSPRARANDEAAAALASLHEENERTERALADYEAFKRDADATDNFAVTQLANLVFDGLIFITQLATTLIKELSTASEFQRTFCPVDQFLAESLFKLGDCLANCRLR